MVIFGAIIFFIFVVGLYVIIDFRLGRKKHQSVLKNNEFPIRYSTIEIFPDGPSLFQTYFSHLRKAEKHIHVLFYICKTDEVSQEFFSILKSKAKEGVEVRLLLDRLGSKSINKGVIMDLKKAGIKFSFCNSPKLPFPFYTAQVRNHRKITVIDGEIGFMGGYNIGKEYINLDEKLNPWRDYHLMILGEGVRDLQFQFLLDWKDATKTNLLQNPAYFPKLEKGSMCHHIVATEGVLLEETFSGLIKKAKSSIIIGTPYFIPSKKVFSDLLDAIDRGVALTVLVPKKSDHILVQEASYPFLRKLLRKGATVFQYLNGFYHAKALIIDEEICNLGTANFDNRSFFLNHEINCFIYDRDLINRAKEVINQDIKDSRKISLKDISSNNPYTLVKEGIAKMIGFFL